MPVISHCWIPSGQKFTWKLFITWKTPTVMKSEPHDCYKYHQAHWFGPLCRGTATLLSFRIEWEENHGRYIVTWTIFGTCRQRLLEVTWNDRNLEWATAIWGAVLSTLSHRFWISCQPRNALVLVEVILKHQKQHHFQVNNFPCNRAIPPNPPDEFFQVHPSSLLDFETSLQETRAVR